MEKKENLKELLRASIKSKCFSKNKFVALNLSDQKHMIKTIFKLNFFIALEKKIRNTFLLWTNRRSLEFHNFSERRWYSLTVFLRHLHSTWEECCHPSQCNVSSSHTEISFEKFYRRIDWKQFLWFVFTSPSVNLSRGFAMMKTRNGANLSAVISSRWLEKRISTFSSNFYSTNFESFQFFKCICNFLNPFVREICSFFDWSKRILLLLLPGGRFCPARSSPF